MVNEGDERNYMRDIKPIKRDVPLDKDHQWHLDLPAITADSKTTKSPKRMGTTARRSNAKTDPRKAVAAEDRKGKNPDDPSATQPRQHSPCTPGR